MIDALVNVGTVTLCPSEQSVFHITSIDQILATAVTVSGYKYRKIESSVARDLKNLEYRKDSDVAHF